MELELPQQKNCLAVLYLKSWGIKMRQNMALGQIVQLVRASSQYTKVVDLIPVRAHTKVNQ